MNTISTISRNNIRVFGMVQGVGFRPFIYQLARKHRLCGWVRNTSGYVEIEVEGSQSEIDNFTGNIQVKAPPAARIERLQTLEKEIVGYTQFEILESLTEPGEYQLISPDLATCPACFADIFKPGNRRFHYPFTNCTNCGPRFTIIKDIPYDRPLTTMNDFKMCSDCQREYDDPANRRFHAQPNACPACGPRLELVDRNNNKISNHDPVTKTAQLLNEGNIVAIKGVGGYLLACNALDDETLLKLRLRKRRPAKPFAVMVRNMEEIEKLCQVSAGEAALLTSPAAPIVLLKTKGENRVSPQVAPGLKYLGIMLPYTPLHHLLMAEVGVPLVMTSGNMSEEPIVKENVEALGRLGSIADYFLMHNRDIHARYDDSVAMYAQGAPRMLRRARGYAPTPIKLGFKSPAILAVGAEMKGAFCVTRDDHAFVSQHIGDMENMETFAHFENTVSLYENLFRINPQIIAHDLHPDYMSTIFAKEIAAARPEIKLVAVQHHHAHIAGVMAENGVSGQVIGVAMDGTGYGTDGAIWGGEFLSADFKQFKRLAHFEYVPLPGGDAATRNPYRIALSYIYYLLGRNALNENLPLIQRLGEGELELLVQQIDRRLNSPVTSSCGRLFDAVAALIDIRSRISYEAQAAIELEMAASEVIQSGDPYSFELNSLETRGVIGLQPLFGAILDDLSRGVGQAEIAHRFHCSLACLIGNVCKLFSTRTGIDTVALSGGVFQNRLLLKLTTQALGKNRIDSNLQPSGALE